MNVNNSNKTEKLGKKPGSISDDGINIVESTSSSVSNVLKAGIDKSNPLKCLENIEDIPKSEHLKLAKLLIENGYGETLCYHINKFSKSEHFNIAKLLIKKGDGAYLCANFKKFTGIAKLEHLKLAKLLIKKGDGGYLCYNFKNFTGIPESEYLNIAELLIENGEGLALCNNIDKFPKSEHLNIAELLIKNGEGVYICYNINKFPESEHLNIAELFIENGEGRALYDNLQKFTGIPESEHFKLAELFIENGEGRALCNNLQKFTGILKSEHLKLAELIIENGVGDALCDNINKFTKSEHLNIAKLLIENRGGRSLCYNFKEFTGIPESEHLKLAELIIEKGEGRLLHHNLQNFTGITNLKTFPKTIKQQQILLSIYSYINGEDGLDGEEYENIKKIIESNSDELYDNIYKEYTNFLKSGKIGKILKYILSIIDDNGLGNMSQLESLSVFFNNLNIQNTTDKTKENILKKLKEVNTKINSNPKNINKSKNTEFFSISSEYLKAAPSLFDKYLDAISKLPVSQFQYFVDKLYSTNQIELAIYEGEDGKCNNKKLADFRAKNIKSFLSELEKIDNNAKNKNSLIKELIEKYNTKSLESIEENIQKKV